MQLICKLMAGFFVLASACTAQTPAPSNPLKTYIKEDAPVIVLNNVRLIDGTGAPVRERMRIDIDDGKIVNVQSAMLRNAFPPGAKVIDLEGKTVFPGMVGMHEHLYYATPLEPKDGVVFFGEAPDSAPRLYLAAGVTTARTAGSVEPYADIQLKKSIDAGELPGPKLRFTAPYLEGKPTLGPQLYELKDAADAGRMVDYWADEGATSFKAYMHITPDELKAAIDHAHAKGLKITGHLCSIGFTEAADMGIDNLEHGLVVDTEFFLEKKPGVCPGQRGPMMEMAKNLEIESAPVQKMIQDLVARHVAVTSTLAIFESFIGTRAPLEFEMEQKQSMSGESWSHVLETRAGLAERADKSPWGALLKKEMEFERSFVKAGGMLMAGCDPTGFGGILAGFGDQRELELLVEAGFTPLEAIHIATENGAKWLGEDASEGTIAAGKAADIVIIDGNPAEKISDVEKVETVFKDGVGYDPVKLRASVQGLAGIR
jgi:imidazolonepropionase-like amidohydrolase